MIMVPLLTGTPLSLLPQTRMGPRGPQKLPGGGPREALAGPLFPLAVQDLALLSVVDLVSLLGVDYPFSSPAIVPLLSVVESFLLVGVDTGARWAV